MVMFGLQHRNFSHSGKGNEIFQTAKKRALRAQEYGFDSFWVMDHFFQIPFVGDLNEPVLECWSALSALAAVTDKIRLGPMVTGNIYRNPAIVAKMGATVDVISKGRLFMGMGAGWFETEALALGVPFYTVSERLDRLEESLQILRGMWTGDSFSFRGKYYNVKDAFCYPKPLQKPYPPILIGGSGENVTLKLVAKYGDACNISGNPQIIGHKLKRLKGHCETIHRDYSDILKTITRRLIFGRDSQDVFAKVQSSLRPGITVDRLNEVAIYGTSSQLIDKIQDFMDKGVEYFIFNMDYEGEEESLKLFAEEIMPVFAP
jgi:F420-dependent oxidoreductase-like protein